MARNTVKPVAVSLSVPRQSRISAVNLQELAAIWDADKRMPSAPSRRAWALARRLRPEQVNNWFYRKKGLAKKSGIILPGDTYELPVGTPPALPNTQSLPPSSSPIPETPMTRSSDYICVKKEDPCYQEERAVAMLSDDPMFRTSLTPAHFSSGSSDAPGSLASCDDNRCDNELGGSRFSTRSAGTRTPLTPAEPSFFVSADTPYIVQPRSYYNTESKNSENRAYISYAPSIPWSYSGQAVSGSGIQSDLELASCFSSYYSGKDSQSHTHGRQALPVSSSVTSPHSVSMPSVLAAPTFFPISQPLQSAKAPSLTGPAQPGIVHYEERIQLLQNLNYTYDIEGQEDRSNESHPTSEDLNATNAVFKQGGSHRYPSCINLSEPSEPDANWNLPYSKLDFSTGSVSKILSPYPHYPVPDITAPSSAPVSTKVFCSRQSSYYSMRPTSTTAATNDPGAYRVSNTGTAASISTCRRR